MLFTEAAPWMYMTLEAPLSEAGLEYQRLVLDNPRREHKPVALERVRGSSPCATGVLGSR